jgi:iron complex transport system substrate-binding protein
MRPMRQALRFLPGIVIAFLAASACNKSNPDQSGPPGSIPSLMGGTELKDPARTIVSLSPGCTEVLAINGASKCLVGRTAACNYPPFVAQYPVVASVKPDWEKIKSAVHKSNGEKGPPDLIVYDPALFNDQDVAQMTSITRLKPFPLGGDTVDQFETKLKELAGLYTGETFMSAYIDKIDTSVRGAKADPVQPEPTVALIMPGQGSEHMIAGTESFYDDEIRQATGKPVGPKGNNFVTLNAESLIQMNPDIVVTAGDADSFVKDPRFQSLAAIKNKRVISASQDAMIRRGARVDQTISQLHNSFADMMNTTSTSSGANK